MKASTIFPAALVSIFFLASCGGSGGGDNRDLETGYNCPDYIEYADPILRIESVVDASRNEELSQVYLSELQINGQVVSFEDVEFLAEPIYNIDIAADGLSAICTVPCGLFTQEGEYSVLFSAPSFESKRMDFKPTYRKLNTQTCPNSYSGSYEIYVTLVPEGYISSGGLPRLY